MSRDWRRACALMFAAALACGISATAADNAASQAFADNGQMIVDPAVQPAGCNTCDAGTGLGLMNGVGGRRGQVFVGAEYLSLRANFSEATAYRDLRVGPPPTEDFRQYEFDYGDSYRIYGGYRLCDCGGEIRFTHSNFDSNGSFDSGPVDLDGGFAFVTAPFEVITAGDGDRLFGSASVQLRDYDIAFSKTIPLGGFCCDTGCCDTGCCDSDCGDSCGGGCGTGCCGCPPWDLQWTGAIRISNVDSTLNYASDIATANGGPNANRNAQSSVSFDGVGLRTGLLGRRYFGKRGMLSAYVKGDISLLLGDVETVISGSNVPTTTFTSTQVVPVTEIEAGVTAFLTQRISVSGGYLLSAWHDLGHRAEYDYTSTTTQIQMMDDANLMTWDGFFLRAEAAF
ncbi:Lpg1974 family pore-forming outer membrane protein [Botrimarina hoheduenensis]|uniref:Legionella pneumophila major outer membrane protein n=1 Tax=Botrimarina hoheduenensis TaxID=2528000 RepID=A0A5C5VZS7_9BACT|nr:Lpg1974 family pore-forming outer membrane protein [Botrimarina hoheduenensis]TWT43309.1 hypothetical protein Pla111_22600 [Botrimarina hoheduenensis]